MKTRFIFIALAALSALPLALRAQQPVIVAPNGERVTAERILVRPNGDLVATIGGQPREIARNQYLQVIGAKPAGIDEAVAQAEAGNLDQVKDGLEEVFRTSAYQSWDAMAGKALVKGALAAGNTADAERVLRTLEQRYGDSLAQLFPEVQILQWKVRIATDKSAGLEQELTEVIRNSDNRLRQGMAQVVRGDLKRRRQDFNAAVLDYLRAVYFYGDLAEIHAEALYKTALTFADIGDTGRLKKYSEELKATYPDSAYASKPIGD